MLNILFSDSLLGKTITQLRYLIIPLYNKRLQDIIASGKYQGIIVCAAYGVGMIPDLKEAIAAGIEIVVLNQIVGPNLNTSDPQVEGIAF